MKMKRSFLLALGCALAAGCDAREEVGAARSAVAGGHPRLLIASTDYAALQAKAGMSPWKEMLASGLVASQAAYKDRTVETNVGKRALAIGAVVGGATLGYVVDPSNRAAYLTRTLAAIAHLPDVYLDKDPASHDFTVDCGSAVFGSLLALDVMHGDLTAAQLGTAEATLKIYTDWLTATPTAWVENVYGVLGAWALYNGDDVAAASAAASYRAALEKTMLVDGPYAEGAGYAIARFGGDRLAKAHFMDLLEHAGKDHFYTDERIGDFYEWLYAGSVTPNRRSVTFGDTDPARTVTTLGVYAANLRGYRFSTQAAENAAWVFDGKKPIGTLLNYVLEGEAPPSPKLPKSHIWSSAAASFWEDDASGAGLMGALWSPTGEGGHSHKDVNAIHLVGFGETLLRNVGYAGWGDGCGGKDWGYVHNTAISSNTVLVGSADHAGKVGGGITEGLTAELFDYASGASGAALPLGAKHQRNLVLVHPQDGIPGYFVLFDEVTGTGAGVSSALHPASTSCSELVAGTRYACDVKVSGAAPVGIDLFYGTAPSVVEVRDGALCALDAPQSYVGRFLYASYAASATGAKHVVTVLAPHDAHHPAPLEMKRVAIEHVSGARLDLGNDVVDLALESDGTAVAIDGPRFAAAAVHLRRAGGALSHVFVRKGTSFDDGGSKRTGFEASAPISLYLRGTRGQVTSAGATVTFLYPELVEVRVDGAAVAPTATATGSLTFELAPGAHTFAFVLGLPLTCGDGILEEGERCDPVASCPAACDDGDACTDDVTRGAASTCDLECVHDPVTRCINGDGCCARGCDQTNDRDCTGPPLEVVSGCTLEPRAGASRGAPLLVALVVALFVALRRRRVVP